VEDARALEALDFAAAVLGAIRRKKSEEQRPLKTPVVRVRLSAPPEQLSLVKDVEADLRAAGLIQQIETAAGETLQVDVELAPAQPDERAS
jgi:valyl-tRNA synthetase